MQLKVDFHTHSADDPLDAVPHTTRELIDRAAALGYHALAITLHDKQLDVEPLRAYAAARSLVLIPGVERTIQGRHVLLINFSTRAQAVQGFEDVAALRVQERGLVIAPHPFFPIGSCLGRELDRQADLFDAVEINAMYVTGTDFNRRARLWAARHDKPLVGNGDVHRLGQLGTTYSLVDAEPDPQAICEAVRAGRVEVRTEPLPRWRAATILADILTAPLRARRRRSLTRPVPFGTMNHG